MRGLNLIGLLVLALSVTITSQAWAGSISPGEQILLSEDFEGDWASRADGWAKEKSIEFQLDTSEAHKGKASLRLSPVGTPDLFYGKSPAFPGEVGPNYRISFWVKATDRINVEVANWAEEFSPYVHWTGFVTSLGWRKITFGGQITRTGYSGVKPVRIQFLVHNQGGKPVTVWIDDLLVEKGADFITQMGWTPPLKDQNLIPNGSFELDPGRDYLQYQGYHSDRGPDENWEFSSDEAYGSRSLKVKSYEDSRYAFFGPHGPPLELIRPLAFTSGEMEFTLAVSVKLVKGNPTPITLVIGGPFNADIPIPSGAITLEMIPTTEWKRHHTTFRLPSRNDGMYFLCLQGGRGSEVLLDGLMLATGTSTEFRPRTPVEATLTSAKPWRIYAPEEPLEFTLRAVRDNSAGDSVLELSLVNYRQQIIRKVEWEGPAKPGQVMEKQVVLAPLPQGCYRAELRITGQPTVLSDMSFSVIPEPRQVPAAQSNYGTNIHTLANTYDWDVSPMIQRLGFRWARLWSMNELERDGYTYKHRNMTLEERLAAGDRWVNNLKQRGWGIFLTIHPRFKYHVGSSQPMPPATEEELADYENNIRDIVTRFGDRIEAYEIGNEPGLPATTPAQYERMVRESVRFLRETDPTATLISLAGAANYETAWIEEALAKGATKGVDGISFHYGGQCSPDTIERYRQIQKWATQGQPKPLQVWDSEEHMALASFYPLRVTSTTGVQDLGEPAAYPAQFTRDLKVYLCNTAMGMRTFFQEANYTYNNAWQMRHYWERDGSLRPGTAANLLAAQMLQSLKGGGFYRTPEGLFIALAHDEKQSVLALWSEKYTGTTQVTQYVDPFDLLDPTPRPLDNLAEVPDFYRDVHPITIQVPQEGLRILDTMTALSPKGSQITIDIYPTYLVVPRGKEEQLLQTLKAKQTLKPYDLN